MEDDAKMVTSDIELCYISCVKQLGAHEWLMNSVKLHLTVPLIRRLPPNLTVRVDVEDELGASLLTEMK